MIVLKRENIRIRDPFIYTDKKNGCYYMYGTTAIISESIAARDTFCCYKTFDLENFEGPFEIFNGSKAGFWADRDFWAAEMHEYKGKYYLFGSCKAEGKCRATQIFVCDTPNGTYVPLSERPVTPPDWECLDGTLFVENGQPYIVFCHEWLQVKDGEIWALPLKDDLSAPRVSRRCSSAHPIIPMSARRSRGRGPMLPMDRSFGMRTAGSG